VAKQLFDEGWRVLFMHKQLRMNRAPRCLARTRGGKPCSTRYYGTASQIVCLAPSGAMASVWAAGRTEKDFRYLACLLAFEWDYSTLEEL
jgi:hypothetical protein